MSPDELELDGPSELLLEATIDDLSPEFFGLLMERLFEAGATEVDQLPALTSDGRQGVVVRAAVPVESRVEVEDAFMLHSTAMTVRAMPLDRVSAGVAYRTVTTRWGEARLRLKIWRGSVLQASPVYDDAAEIARSSGAPLSLIYGEATRLGEVFIGQRVEPD